MLAESGAKKYGGRQKKCGATRAERLPGIGFYCHDIFGMLPGHTEMLCRLALTSSNVS
jgi:hypothetical protein